MKQCTIQANLHSVTVAGQESLCILQEERNVASLTEGCLLAHFMPHQQDSRKTKCRACCLSSPLPPDWKTALQISCRKEFSIELISGRGGTSFQVLALLCISTDASPLTPFPMLLIEVSELSPHSAVLNLLRGSLTGHNYPAVLDLFHPHSSFYGVKA